MGLVGVSRVCRMRVWVSSVRFIWVSVSRVWVSRVCVSRYSRLIVNC